jgi:hypothetical protein
MKNSSQHLGSVVGQTALSDRRICECFGRSQAGFKHGISTFQESHRSTEISKFPTKPAFSSAVLCSLWLTDCKQTALPLKHVQNPSSGKVQ